MQIHTTYDPTRPALQVRELTVIDQAVVSESRRWSTGARSTSVGEDGMVGVDLSRFVEHALVVGVHAIGAASTAQESVALERLVTEVGARTVTATNEALGAANTAVSQASEAMRTAADGARKAITDASRDARQGFAEDVDRARANLLGEVNRLVGGSNPELIDRLRPLLDTFGRELNGRIAQQTGELFDAAARQFDPADPTSPMAKHTSTLQHHHETLRSALDSNHRELAAKVAELTVAVKVAVSARDAAEQTASITPLKGVGYATRLHPILEQIATGLGDEYTDTGALCGVLPRCKKGDGVLTVAGGQIRVVVEMTAGKRNNWNDYLDEAQRNRAAVASLGLVRDRADNGGNTIRSLGPRRIVLAFDPDTDDLDLLRTVVQLLRLAALSAGTRRGQDDLDTASEKITEALTLLTKIDEIRKLAAIMRQHAGKVEDQSEAFRASLTRLLRQAQEALENAGNEAAVDVA